MSHLPRLLRVISVLAKYRLDEFLDGQARLGPLRSLLWPLRLRWIFGHSHETNRNKRLRLALEELGPIYIKFGQLLSTRRDFLDPALADELQSLQDQVPPFQEPGIESIVKQALGTDAASVFKEIDPTPLASASVAQVHAATLLNGDEVVIKVIRPGIDSTIAEDIRLLKWLAGLVESRTRIGRRLRPVEVVNDYEKIILDELNLQAEGANASQLRKNFEGSAELYVPKIYWDFTRANMLVMERIYGIPVTRLEQLDQAGINLKALAETGVNIFFTQVFEHNFFHADMHPGNIFVSRENPEQPQYIAIDCAIIGSLSKADQEYLAKNLLAIFKRDYRRVAELHVECGWVPPSTPVAAFESAMRSVCEPIFEKPLKDISFAHLLLQLFRTAGRFDMEVQPSLVLLQKTLLNIEGLGRQLYPELDLWQTALPYLERWNSQRLNPLTLLRRLREEVPDWADRLPELPVQILDSLSQRRELAEIRDQLQQQLALQARAEERRQRSRRRGGIAVLVLAATSLILPADALTGAPVLTGLLALGGLWLLSFD